MSHSPKEKSPAFQFYVRDFLSDVRVMAMSYEERGIYVTLMSVCWNERGALPADRGVLARIVGLTPRRFEKAWRAIEPCFERRGDTYRHKRLDRELAKQAAYSAAMSENGKRGGRPRNAELTDEESRGFSAAKPNESSSSSTASSPSSSTPQEEHSERNYSPEFEAAWTRYPRRANGNPKKLAWKAWSARVREGIEPAQLAAAVDGYARTVRAAGKEGTEFVLQGATFFGPGERWKEYVGEAGADAVRERAARLWQLYKARGMTSLAHGGEWWDAEIPAAAAELEMSEADFREVLKKVRPWDVAKVAQSTEWAVGEVLRRLAA